MTLTPWNSSPALKKSESRNREANKKSRRVSSPSSPSSVSTRRDELTVLLRPLLLSLGEDSRVATEAGNLGDVEDVGRVPRTVDACREKKEAFEEPEGQSQGTTFETGFEDGQTS